MSRRRVIEGRWTCSSCDTADIGGRHKVCPTCGNPREGADGENTFDFGGTTASGASTAETVTTREALDQAEAGVDWHCTACGAANRGDVTQCRACGSAPGEAPPPPDPVPTPASSKGGCAKLLSAVALVVGVGGFWATRTQDLLGEASRSWTHTVSLQRFQPLTTGGWQGSLRERAPVMPVDGGGEVAGVTDVRDCQQKQSGTRKVADGTERVCTDRTRQVADGTREQCTVKDLGNGFAEEVCTDVTVYRSESYEECEDRTRYRDEPVYDTWCTYDTWTWKSVDEASSTGTWDTPTWPELTTGALDRTARTAEYLVVIAYPWRGGTKTHEVVPPDLAALESWYEGQGVTLEVSNLGSVGRVLVSAGHGPQR